jgi:hypothetical protein
MLMTRRVLLGLLTLTAALGALAFTACGGGGGGGNGVNNPPPGPQFLAPLRYFPSPLGAVYTYRATSLADPLFGLEDTPLQFKVEPNPLGPGVHYNMDETTGLHRGPQFDGLRFTALAEDVQNGTLALHQVFVSGPGDSADVLPAQLTAVGQQWPLDVRLGSPGGTFLARFTVAGTATLGGVEDITLGGTTLQDCLRVDVSFNYRYLAEILPAFTGSYWLAPDIGPVLGVCRVGGVEVGRVELLRLVLP